MDKPQQMSLAILEFVRDVVPELQRRGLFRHEYQGPTLRDHLGIARPANPQTRRA